MRIYTRQISAEEARVASLWPQIEMVRAKTAAQLSDSEKKVLLFYFLNRQFNEYIDMAQQLQALRDEQKTIASAGRLR